jgi:hypothetical protein
MMDQGRGERSILQLRIREEKRGLYCRHGSRKRR